MSTFKGIIYRVTNSVNGKIYIGKTTYDLRKRKWMHHSASKRKIDNSYFHKAIRKYGTESFIWEEIDSASTEEDLNKLEIKHIAEYKEKYPIYNLTAGGEGSTGYRHSVEAKREMSKRRKGKPLGPFTEEHRENLRKANLGKKHTKEHREKVSKSLIGNKRCVGFKKSPESIEKFRRSHSGEKNWNYGKHLSDETKEKIAATKRGKPSWAKGKKFTKEHCENISKAKKNISDETRAKMRISQQKRREKEACHV